MNNKKKQLIKKNIPKDKIDATQEHKKRQTIKKREIPFVILGIIFIVAATYGIISSKKKYNSLKVNWEYTNGIIYEFYLGTRATWRLRYDYSVDGNKYQGYGRWYPNTDTLSVGDTIEIVYDATNVSYSRTVRDARW